MAVPADGCALRKAMMLKTLLPETGMESLQVLVGVECRHRILGAIARGHVFTFTTAPFAPDLTRLKDARTKSAGFPNITARMVDPFEIEGFRRETALTLR